MIIIDAAVLDPFWLRTQMGVMTSDYSTIFSTSVYHNLVFDIPLSGTFSFSFFFLIQKDEKKKKKKSTVVINNCFLDDQIGATEMVGMEKQVREVMSQVGLDSYFSNLPLGYNTMLGENGLQLSFSQVFHLILFFHYSYYSSSPSSLLSTW